MVEGIKNDLLKICKLLDQYKVQYMIIGGVAVALNGYYRPSMNNEGQIIEKPDMDIWYNPTYENYFNILKVFELLGIDITEYKNDKEPNPRNSYFKFQLDEITLDFLPEIKTKLKFSDAYTRRDKLKLEGLNIYILNYHDLIEDKKATARKKDLNDIIKLKNINSKE